MMRGDDLEWSQRHLLRRLDEDNGPDVLTIETGVGWCRGPNCGGNGVLVLKGTFF